MGTKDLHREHYYRLLGKILVEFNELEHVILREIVDFLKPSTGESLIDLHAILSFLPFESKIRVFRILFSKYRSTELSKLNKVYKQLVEIQKKRNDYFHSWWYLDAINDDDTNVMKTNFTKFFGVNKRHEILNIFISKLELKSFLKEIKQARFNLYSLSK